MCVHRRCVVWLWTVECACTNGVLCGCGQLDVCAQKECCVVVGSLIACTGGVLYGCGQLNVRAQTVCCVAADS